MASPRDIILILFTLTFQPSLGNQNQLMTKRHKLLEFLSGTWMVHNCHAGTSSKSPLSGYVQAKTQPRWPQAGVCTAADDEEVPETQNGYRLKVTMQKKFSFETLWNEGAFEARRARPRRSRGSRLQSKRLLLRRLLLQVDDNRMLGSI